MPGLEREADDGAVLNVDGVNTKVGVFEQIGELHEREIKLAMYATTFANPLYC